MRRIRGSPSGAIPSAHLPLLGQLSSDFLPIKVNVGIQPTHLALVVGVERVSTDAHDMKVAPAAFDREIAKPLPGRDKGAALLASHRLLPVFLF
jgi:hypothetical protein